MRKTPIYDLPLRFFHWTFVVLFLCCLYIVKIYEEGTEVYAYHMIFGLMLAMATLLRIIWGFVGSEYSKFSSFPLGPTKLWLYFINVFKPSKNAFVGHNPASSWAALAMFLCSLGLAITGILMGQELGPDYLEEVHEFLSDAFWILAAAHVVGLILHALVHRDRIELTMLTGTNSKKHGLIACIFILLLTSFGFHLVRSYDVSAGTISFFGMTLEASDPEEN